MVNYSPSLFDKICILMHFMQDALELDHFFATQFHDFCILMQNTILVF